MVANVAQRHNPPEVWFRGVRPVSITRQLVTATVRLGMRNARHPKGYAVGDRLIVRCLSANGRREIAQLLACVRDIRFTCLAAVRPEDLRGCASNERFVERLRRHLAAAYGRTIGEREMLTIVRFQYLAPRRAGG